ncbi:MAG TPA: hypothetical protein VNJ08_15795 [Bacteriovoracaceae bacterium]|nr:hypothetical protein [Bacteriovoracaceae bacterium]
MWWPLFFFTALLFAEDDSVEKYCFRSPTQMERAYAQFTSISVPSDRAVKEESCLVISSKPHRRELIQKYLLSVQPDMSISFSSQDLRRDPCEIQVEKIRYTQESSQNIELSKNPNGVATELKKNATETFHITTLKDFEISVNQDKIQGVCKYVSPQRYEITLTVLKEAKLPLSPYIMPEPNQQTSSLKTQIQLQRGSKVEIGSVVRNLKSQAHIAGGDPKVDLNKDERNYEEKTFLSIH